MIPRIAANSRRPKCTPQKPRKCGRHATHEHHAQANKLSRTYAVLLEALNRQRGKGQQKVIVEHATSTRVATP